MRPMPELRVESANIDDLTMNPLNSKLHPAEQIDQIAASIEEFGNCDPLGVWTNDEGELVIVEGHGRYMALRKLGIETVPIIRLDHLTDEQRRAYGLAHNKLTMNSDFDFELLANELDMVTSIDMGDFGFDMELGALDISDMFDEDQEGEEKGDSKPQVKTVTCPDCGKEFEVEL